MKKTAKKLFSGAIVLAMLCAMLPAGVAQAAIAKASWNFEEEALPAIQNIFGTAIVERTTEEAYNGAASMKVIQNDTYHVPATGWLSLSEGKTYRIRARVKLADPSADSKAGFHIYTGGTVTDFSTTGDIAKAADSRGRTKAQLAINDSEWHLIENVFTIDDKNSATSTVSTMIGVEVNSSAAQTYYVDDFSVVEVLSFDDAQKDSFMAVKGFEGVITEVTAGEGTNAITKDTTEAYEVGASAKAVISMAGRAFLDIGTYDFEVGQYYRVTSYIKTQYPEGQTGNKSIRYEFKNANASNKGVVSVKSRLDSYTDTRPGFSLGFVSDEPLPNVGNGWSRLGGAPVNEKDNNWLRHERIFTVNSTDAEITSAPLIVSIYTDLPVGSTVWVDSVKIEKMGIDGSHKALSNYGGTVSVSGGNASSESGLATVYKFVASATNDNHSPNMTFNLEKGKQYIAKAKIYVPSSNEAAVNALIEEGNIASEPTISFGGAKHTLEYDKWIDLSCDIDWTEKESGVYRFSIDGINIGYRDANNTYHTVAETFYFSGFDVTEIKDSGSAAGLPDISFESGNWDGYGATADAYGELDGKTARKVTKTASYTFPYVTAEGLEDGNAYLAKIKYYIPQDQWAEGTQIRFFLIDNNNSVNGRTNDPSYAMHSKVIDVTEDMTNSWIDVQLPFTHSAAATDSDGIYWLNVCTSAMGADKYYYIADPCFVDVNKANITDVEIGADGTVSYKADNADYAIEYEYLDGTTVIEKGILLAGEFLPKFDLIDVEEPTVKLTASNAYGLSEETVTGTKAAEETPDIGDDTKGSFAVNSVSVISVENEDAAAATTAEELKNGMYVSINYTNSTSDAKKVWLVMAFYDANGLLSASKREVSLAVTEKDIANDIAVPENEEEQIDFAEGATEVKAFVWETDGIEPLCARFAVE